MATFNNTQSHYVVEYICNEKKGVMYLMSLSDEELIMDVENRDRSNAIECADLLHELSVRFEVAVYGYY